MGAPARKIQEQLKRVDVGNVTLRNAPVKTIRYAVAKAKNLDRNRSGQDYDGQ